MGRFQAKHWALLLSGVLTALLSMIGTSDHWGDVVKPQAVAAFIGQMAVLISTLFVGAPPNPDKPQHRHHRKSDTVSDATRRNL